MKLITVMERPELLKLQYMVIVETWKSVMQCGSKRRKYHATFTEDERAIIAKHYKIYTRWYGGYSGGGLPNNHAMTLRDYQLMIRAANFFGTI